MDGRRAAGNRGGADEGDGVLSTPPTRTEAVPPRAPITAGGAISLDAAAAHRGSRPVWSGVDLRIGEGEFVAVLGPNGAGKSTLLRVASGLLAPARGDATLAGKPVATLATSLAEPLSRASGRQWR